MALALYRKYRPAKFAEVVGQEHVTQPLSVAIEAGRINHAYLFSGPRGCGKTSSARILARSLNCELGPTPEPCGVCPSCVSLAPGGPGNIDVTELDAASHGGVDDTRELRDRAFFAPAESRYRVFIVDEAHMITTQGFNALLKIVEEPPEHLVFVFATTEPEKVLPTIRSRTHHYPFRLIPPGTLRKLLERICAEEQVAVAPAVYPLVIRAGGGSARDSLSVLDQLVAGAGPEGVTYERAVALLGVTDVSLIDDVVDALAAGDRAAVFEAVDRLVEAGHDPRRFATDLLQRLRDLTLLQAVPEAVDRGLVEAADDEVARMVEQSSKFGAATLTRYGEILHVGLTEMRGATAPRLLLELLCARMLLPAATTGEPGLLERLERLERRSAIAASPPEPGEAGSVPASAPYRPAAAVGGDRSQPVDGGSAQPVRRFDRPGARTTVTGDVPPSPAAADRGAPPAAERGARPAVEHGASAAAERGASAAAEDGAPRAAGRGEAAAAQSAASAAAERGAPASAGRGAPAAAERGVGVERGAPAAAGRGSVAGDRAAPAAAERGAPAGAGRGAPAAVERGASSAVERGAPAAAERGAGSGAAAAERGTSPGAPSAAAPVAAGAGAPENALPPAAPTPEREAAAVGAADVRRVWQEIQEAVKQRKKRTAALLVSATVRAVDHDTLVLSIGTAPLARLLSEQSNTDVIAEALHAVLGVRWRVRCEHGDASAPRAQEPRQASRPAGGGPSARAAHAAGDPSPGGPPQGSRPPVASAGGRPSAPAGSPPESPPRSGPRWQPGSAAASGARPSGRPSGRDEGVPLPPEPPEDDTPPDDEEAMLAELAAGPSEQAPPARSDPEEAAIALLTSQLGARAIDRHGAN